MACSNVAGCVACQKSIGSTHLISLIGQRCQKNQIVFKLSQIVGIELSSFMSENNYICRSCFAAVDTATKLRNGVLCSIGMSTDHGSVEVCIVNS